MTAHDHTGDDYQAAVPAAAGSALSSLRQQRQEIRNALYFDLQVPRYPDPVFVRFSPVSNAVATRVEKSLKNYKADDRTVTIAAAILAECCVGIFNDATAADAPDTWPRFDEELAQVLESDATRAVDLVRELYFTDGDIMTTLDVLQERSGFDVQALQERERGN